MKIIITENQLSLLIENTQGKALSNTKVETTQLYKRCKAAKRMKIQNSPWCELLDLYQTKLTNKLKKRLNEAIKNLLSVYKKNLNTGILPNIIKISLMDTFKTVNDLESIAHFLTDKEFSQDKIKKQLVALNLSNRIPSKEELRVLLKNARYKDYTNYENSFDGEQFEPSKTALKFEHRCEQEMDDKFFNLIKKVKVNKEDVSEFLQKFIGCIKQSMDSIDKPIKSDKYLKEDLYVIDGDEKTMVLPKGYYEVKKLDPFIDSYLSEFFSIFKESKLKEEKPEYLDFYNKIIQIIYEWIDKNGQDYLNRVRENMNGVIYKDNVIIPIKYIDLYWSNKGQPGCREKRISIRYRLNPKFSLNEIEAYRYTLNSNIVERVSDFDLTSLNISSEKQICP